MGNKIHHYWRNKRTGVKYYAGDHGRTGYYKRDGKVTSAGNFTNSNVFNRKKGRFKKTREF